MFVQALIGKVSDATVVRMTWERWGIELRPGATGFLGSTAGVGEDGTFIAVVRFESAAAARTNGARPEQGRWWAEMSSLFVGEVVFLDCEEVIEFLDGGSDEAEFVQVMVGAVTDREAAREVPTAAERALRQLRPDIIGGTRAFSGDRFVETVYFTSEDAARAGEAVDLPEIVRDLDQAIIVERFINLSNPFVQ